MNSRKPTLTMPSTETTRASMVALRLREKISTAPVHSESMVAHSSSDPSWAPHTAEMR